MLKKAKIFLALSTVFLALVVFSPIFSSIGLAGDVTTSQVINSGTLSFLDVPTDFSFSSLASSTSAQTSTYVPTEGPASTGDLIVQDLRFSGGFSVTLQATAFTNQYNNSFTCSAFSFLTFDSEGVGGIETSSNVVPGTADVTAPYNSDPTGRSPSYTSMVATGGDATVCEPVEILSGTAGESEGRIGSWKLYPAYRLTVPAFAPPGTYSSTITFTLVDDTTVPSPFGDNFTITSSTPATSSTIYYQTGNDETSFTPGYTIPSYSGGFDVTLFNEVCTSATLTTCASVVELSDIYSMVSTDGGSQGLRVTKNDLYSAINTLGISSGQTVYYRLRLAEEGGVEVAESTNYYTFLATEDALDGGTDDWDTDDDGYGGATVLGAPTPGIETHGPHTLSDIDHYDWFAFTLTNGESYQFEGTSGSGDTYAELYNGLGAALGVYNNDSGEGLMFRIDHTATYSGTHYVLVRCASVGADCGYTLSYGLSDGSGGNDSWDSADDIIGGATNLGTPAVGTSTHGPHTLSATDSYDWFMFSLPSGNTFTFTAISGDGDTYGELYSSDGVTRVAYDDDSAGSLMFSVNYPVLSSGTYYLRARCFSVGADCGYTLQIDRAAD